MRAGTRFGAPTDSGAYAEAATTPTLEELTATGTLASSISAAYSFPLWIAPFACSITQFSLKVWNADITASDTNYWSVELGRYRANAGAAIATKTTQATGGEAISRRTDWNFDALTFNATNQVFAKGDSIYVKFTPTGTPTALNVILMTARYEPS